MRGDRISHLLIKPLKSGETGYYWNPSKTLRDLGMCPEALGTDVGAAHLRASQLNLLANEIRQATRIGQMPERPDSFSALCKAYKASDEFKDLKPRTRKDYAYYLEKTEMKFGRFSVGAITSKACKDYYKNVRAEKGITWAYHILATLRTILSWAVSEDWLEKNPALDVKMKSPGKRRVVWSPEQAEAYIAKARELGWVSVAVMARIFDSIGQSPVDVRTMLREAYNGTHISHARTKTGVTDAPIPLFPEARADLDAYLEANARLPKAPIFLEDVRGVAWSENRLQRVHRAIRKAAGLPGYLQLQDFRTTALTEGGAAGGTVDELRGLGRHATRSVGEHYVITDPRFVESAQEKRLAYRNERSQKVRM
jgi:hypothetical protein